MNQKEKIISLLHVNGIMTQGELAEAIYGDKLHSPNIYSALMSLVSKNVVTRSGAHPAKYALSGAPISEQVIAFKKKNLPKRENTEEQQYKAQQQTVTMSAEYATQLILDYFNETIEDTVIRSKSSAVGKQKLADWLLAVEVMDLPEFNDCTKAYHNWFNEILNSMDVPWSNGFIEGCNNKTKVLKRVCFGMRNFRNFRNRILFCRT